MVKGEVESSRLNRALWLGIASESLLIIGIILVGRTGGVYIKGQPPTVKCNSSICTETWFSGSEILYYSTIGMYLLAASAAMFSALVWVAATAKGGGASQVPPG